MFGIPTFDLLTDAGKQGFIEYMVNLTRKEIVSYTPSYTQAGADVSGYVKQVDFDNHVVRTTSVHGITNTADLVYTSDARLSDARTPTSHAATHIPGGSDAIDLTKITAIAATLPTLPDVLYPAGALISIGTVAPYLLYRSTGSAWDQIGGAGGGIEVSDTAPATPSADDLWYNSSNGKTYIYYDSFWVEVGNTGAVDITADTIIPAGMIMPTAGSVEPSGWLYCYGQNLSRATYARLFTAVGTTYGAGDGSTTFGMPDLRGRTIAGRDNMGGSTASRLTAAGSGITGTNLGAAGGAETHTLTTAQIPAHGHTFSVTGTVDGGAAVNFGSNYTVGGRTSFSGTTANAGGGGTHLNTQPTIILNYLIKT
jgi:microcystin-dependent protein